jgi:hypothetical protein
MLWTKTLGTAGGKITTYARADDGTPPSSHNYRFEFCCAQGCLDRDVRFTIETPFTPPAQIYYGGRTYNVQTTAYKLLPTGESVNDPYPQYKTPAVFIDALPQGVSPSQTQVFGSNNLGDPNGWHPIAVTDPGGWTPPPVDCRPSDPPAEQGGHIVTRITYAYYVLAKPA